MSHPLTVELSETAYAALQLRAHAAAQSPAAVAATALEQHFAAPEKPGVRDRPPTEDEPRAYADRHEDG